MSTYNNFKSRLLKINFLNFTLPTEKEKITPL